MSPLYVKLSTFPYPNNNYPPVTLCPTGRPRIELSPTLKWAFSSEGGHMVREINHFCMYESHCAAKWKIRSQLGPLLFTGLAFMDFIYGGS